MLLEDVLVTMRMKWPLIQRRVKKRVIQTIWIR